MKTSYSRHGSSHLGKRGKRVKRVPITGVELDALIAKNKAIEEAQNHTCISCGNEIEHNYGTDEYPQCILCGNMTGVIDETWEEIDLSGFIKDNPTAISDLKKKYKI